LGEYLPTFYDGAKTYLQSSGVGWFDIGQFNDAVAYVASLRAPASNGEIDENVLRDRGSKASYLMRLLWYLGFVSLKYDKGKHLWTASSKGKAYGGLATSNPRAATVGLYQSIASWWPMRVFLTFAGSKQSFEKDDVSEVLGKEMLMWTELMLKFGFKVKTSKPVRKPFNDFVVRRCFFELGAELGLVEKSGTKYSITDAGRQLVADDSRQSWDVVRSGPEEPFAYAAICDVLSSQDDVTAVSPWLDFDTARRIGSGLSVRPRGRLRLVMRDPTKSRTRGHREALQYFRQQLSTTNVKLEVGILPSAGRFALHAKCAVGKGRGVLTSANLLTNSLWRNLEVATFFYDTPPQLASLAEDIWSNSIPLV